MGATAKKIAGFAGAGLGAALAPFTGGASLGLTKLALPFALGAGSAALSALGNKGTQQKQNQQTTGTFDQSGESTSTENFTTNQLQNIDEYNQVIERPEDQAFRQGLGSLLGGEIRKAQRPIFGDAQKAAFLGDLNDLGRSAIKNLSSTLAGSGRLDSGEFTQGAENIELGRLGEASRFFSQLPFQEEQRRASQTQGLLGLGGQLASLAPRDQRRTGVTTGITEGTGTRNSTFTQKGNQSSNTIGNIQGPSFLSGLASNLGGLGGLAFGQLLNRGFGSPGGFPNLQLPGRTPPFTPAQFYGLGPY